MMENKTGLQAVAAAAGGLISIDGIMAYEHSPPQLAFADQVAFREHALECSSALGRHGWQPVDNFVKNPAWFVWSCGQAQGFCCWILGNFNQNTLKSMACTCQHFKGRCRIPHIWTGAACGHLSPWRPRA